MADGLDSYSQSAAEMLAGGEVGGAFDISREPLKVRERYGAHSWGQQALLARRLAEVGVPYTLVNFNLNQKTGQDWDNHNDIFNVMKTKLLPPTDRAISALLDDLEERGLLDSTLVAVYSEFGRTPKINDKRSRMMLRIFGMLLAPYTQGLKVIMLTFSYYKNLSRLLLLQSLEE